MQKVAHFRAREAKHFVFPRFLLGFLNMQYRDRQFVENRTVPFKTDRMVTLVIAKIICKMICDRKCNIIYNNWKLKKRQTEVFICYVKASEI